MEPRTRIWLMIGIFLLLLGLISSLMQEGERVSPRQRGETTLPPARELKPEDIQKHLPAESLQPQPQVVPREPERPKRDRLIRVDPIRGVQEDEEDIRYFQ